LNQKPKRLNPVTIIYNGAKITLNKTGTSIVVRDKHGHFVGMRALPTVIEALEEAIAEGTLNLQLCEVEPKRSEQQPLDFSVKLAKVKRSQPW
jgi:hypothetical protein